MLYKPSNPSPYNSVIEVDDNLRFTASCTSTSDVTGLRLSIKDNTCEIYLPILPMYTNSCLSQSGISIPNARRILDGILDYSNGYKIQTSDFTRTNGLTDVTSITDIIKPFNDYRWQIRLYQNIPTMNIGYGFVQQVIPTYTNAGVKQNRYILKARPHTNMFWKPSSSDSNNNSTYNTGVSKQFTEYYDDKVKYKIQISGKEYEIKEYYYAKTKAYYNSSGSLQNINLQKQYEEPLYAYIEIDLEESTTISVGDQYTILTNYLDSNEYFFECRQLSNVEFKDRNNKVIDTFVDIASLDTQDDENTYKPAFSNVQIKGSFPKDSASSINFYRVCLYRVISNSEDMQIADNGYVTGSEIDYNCRDLLDGYLYKLIVTITDTYGSTTSKGTYILPSYGSIIKPKILSVKPYPEHNSIILDFSKFMSMTGVESNPYDGSYTISPIKADWNGDLSKYTNVKEEQIALFDETSSVNINACYIADDNSVSFSKIDGTNTRMECQRPLISMVFRCNSGDTQTIFSVKAGDAEYKVRWEKDMFCFEAYDLISYTRPTISYDENGNPVMSTITTTQRERVCQGFYTPYKETGSEYTHNAMTNTNKDYSTAYLAYENMPMGADSNDTDGSNIYMHTESAAHDFWWHTMIYPNSWEICCINAPENHLWAFGNVSSGTFSYYANMPRKGGETILTLFGGCAYTNILIDEYNSDSSSQNLSKLRENPLRDLIWNDNTVFQANFAGGKLVGGNFDGGFAVDQYNNVDHYRIYKTFGNQPELHKVFETNSVYETIIEDFTIGSECEYTYYIVPVCKDKDGAETSGSIIKSDPITLYNGIVRVIGLIQDNTELDTYYVDMNNIWDFSLNISNTGFANNMAKTYNDTPQRFPVEIKNKGFYRTFNINGLLGRYDCTSNSYIDTYDDIIEWERFVDNGEMKLVIDLRGIMTVGTMESNGVDYDEYGAQTISANFSIRQLEDVNNITILNRSLLFNPFDKKLLLKENNELALQDNEDQYLIVEGDVLI